MEKIGKIDIRGLSGETYRFDVYDQQSVLKAISVVYLISKRTENQDKSGFYHNYIYFGQTENLYNRMINHHKAECFVKHGANCISILAVDDEKRRLEIEGDLIKQYSPPRAMISIFYSVVIWRHFAHEKPEINLIGVPYQVVKPRVFWLSNISGGL
ncbi:GIY-YIG nuclease family protein [Acidibrevibacterium fodinaquatile]|uniref:GIY-YIG nuclease family protein n=1 Tax=Acidibrevibacterium fodinaquatile TaxID=1969806 RepID=UPI000E0DEF6D|nr:GIY-YIG nuclease family protein [Acidibrevibacterium fodinaquatile]